MKKNRPTIKEIAEKTGVSVGTVHRAIYGKEGVGEETRRRILEEVERINYHVDEVASSLKRKEMTIAVVLPKVQGEERFYFRGIWEGIRQAVEDIRKYKVNFLFYESEYGLNQLSKELQQVYDKKLDEIDGLITLSDCEESNEWISRFCRRGVSVVLISSYGAAEDCLCSIRVDHEKAGKLAAEYILMVCNGKPGKILIFTGDKNIFSNKRYVDSFIQKVQVDEPERELICIDGFGIEEVENNCRKILETEDISGIFSCNARNTYTVSKILNEMQRKDIIFVGTDVFYELESFFNEGILNASIYQYNKEQGKEAVEILYRYLVFGKKGQEREYLPIGLVLKSNKEFFMN